MRIRRNSLEINAIIFISNNVIEYRTTTEKISVVN